MSISKKAWTFPGRPYYYILYFQKLIEIPTTVRQKEERDILGPRNNPEGTSCLAGSSVFLWPCHGLGAPRRLPTESDIHVQIISFFRYCFCFLLFPLFFCNLKNLLNFLRESLESLTLTFLFPISVSLCCIS